MRNYKVLLLVMFFLIGSTILFVGRWQSMPATIAQAKETPILLLQGERLWTSLETLTDVLDAKVEDRGGRRVFCRQDQCLFLDADATRSVNGVELVDLLWIADALGLRSQRFGGIRQNVTETSSDQGKLAPDFVLPDLDGKPYALSDFRGKKTVVYIWGSW